MYLIQSLMLNNKLVETERSSLLTFPNRQTCHKNRSVYLLDQYTIGVNKQIFAEAIKCNGIVFRWFTY